MCCFRGEKRSFQKLHIQNTLIAHLVTSNSCPHHLSGYWDVKSVPSTLEAALLQAERSCVTTAVLCSTVILWDRFVLCTSCLPSAPIGKGYISSIHSTGLRGASRLDTQAKTVLVCLRWEQRRVASLGSVLPRQAWLFLPGMRLNARMLVLNFRSVNSTAGGIFVFQ